MIVPMMKYSFLVFHAGYDTFLGDLKKIGALHIETKRQELPAEIQELYRNRATASRYTRLLAERIKGKKVKGDKPPMSNGEEVIERIKEIELGIEQKQQQLTNLEKETRQLQPWGQFNTGTLLKIKEAGIWFHFLSCREKHYNTAWENHFTIQSINTVNGTHYFVVIGKADEQVQELLDFHAIDELQFPTRSLAQVNDEKAIVKNELGNLEHELDLIAAHCGKLVEDYATGLEGTIDQDNALYQTTALADGKVMLIEGYVPKPRSAELEKYCDEQDILYIAREPMVDEKVPVLLKNNRFNRLFEVIGGLYELPNHKELDLVPFFAPFYMMFFGFSLGDAGYGLLILLVTIFLKLKIKDAKTRSIISLAQWLGAATVLFGALTGTFFGINLIEKDIAWLDGIRQYMVDTDRMFTLALILGAIQILFGMVLKVINISRTKGLAHVWSTIGWLTLIIGSGTIYALNQTGSIDESARRVWLNVILGLSAAMILLLNNPRRNMFVNVLAGLWDVYSMVTGLVGDLLSYIRLFALGVSSAILGFVFNELAMSLSPEHVVFGPLVMITILILGHSMTLFMSGLGAFVHPIRLTFVEFYKNAGFTGGGKHYKPFTEKKRA